MMLEIAFNNVMRSDRHASGFALRFPRILQLRRDKPLSEVDTVELEWKRSITVPAGQADAQMPGV